jgi:hypothetical protein
VLRTKSVPTVRSLFSVTTHPFVPLQIAVPKRPVHPENVEPGAGDSPSVTRVPAGKAAEHVPGQSIPAGLLVTVPEPAPNSFTVRVYDGESLCNRGDPAEPGDDVGRGRTDNRTPAPDLAAAVGAATTAPATIAIANNINTDLPSRRCPP